MPYKLEKNRDGSFKLVNTETGHILAEHTSAERAMKQIKAIHAHKNTVSNKYVVKKRKGMPKRHIIRKNIEILRDRQIKNPKHRKFVDMTKKLLKHEEIYGGSFWDDAWDFTKDVLAFPRDIIENVPFVKPALEMGLSAVAGPEAGLALDLGLQASHFLYGDNTNKGLKETWNSSSSSSSERDAYNDFVEQARINNASMPRAESNAATPNYTVEDAVDETIQDIVNSTTPNGTRRQQTAREQILDPYGSTEQPAPYNPLEHLIASSVLAFPPTLHFDPRDEPLPLVKFLESQSIAGVNVSQREYDEIVKRQQPYIALSFPDNGFYKHYPSSQSTIN